MQFDAYGASLPLEDVAGVARAVEELGFSGLWFTESKRPPYLGCAVAGEVTDALTIGTAIAVAFPRSPMITAQTAWELARATRGRFSLGLGTQVKAHIERRFSMGFEHPAAKLRDYVLAMRAIFRAFQGDEPLHYEGDFYSFTLLTDFFSPGPSEHPDIPLSVAGVNVGMAHLAGEVFDGFHVHPFHSPRYLDERIRPAIAESASGGGARRGRRRDHLPGVHHRGRRRVGTRGRSRVGPPPARLLRLDAHVPPGLRAARLGATRATSCTA